MFLAVVASGRDDEAKIRFTVELRDGSKIGGTPDASEMKLKTDFGSASVPLALLREIQLGTGKTARVTFANGDRVTGLWDARRIIVMSTVGSLDIALTNIASIAVAISPKADNRILPDGLLLHYSFNENNETSVNDDSGNGHTGEVVGARWIPDDKNGGYYNFNGNDCVRVGDFFDLGGANPSALTSMMACVWVKLPANSHRHNVFMLSKQTPQSPYMGWAVATTSEDFPAADMITTRGVRSQSLDAQSIGDGQWHFLCAYFEVGDNFLKTKLYVDGALRVTNTVRSASVGTVATPVDFWIGQRAPNGTQGVFGDMDEIRIYGRELSELEVFSLANDPSGRRLVAKQPK